MTQLEEQVISLAAIFQAGAMVDQLAKNGDAPEEYTVPLLDSLFVQNPDTFAEIYPNAYHDMRSGLKKLRVVLSREARGMNPDITRYALSLLHLERKLNSQPDMLSALGAGIQNAGRQAEHFSIQHENTQAAVADLYKNTLSQLSFRIRVTGNSTYLQNTATANRVRALLLTGVRAAMLWRQVGGRRWHLLLKRKTYLKQCEQLLDASQTHHG